MGDETIRVLNPNNKTWYEIAANQNLGVLLGTPDVTIEPTAEKATIAGQRAERFRFTQALRIPLPEGTALPADFPQDLQLSGDLRRQALARILEDVLRDRDAQLCARQWRRRARMARRGA